MEHALTDGGAAVDDDAEVAMTLGDRDLRRQAMQMADERVVGRRCSSSRTRVALASPLQIRQKRQSAIRSA